MATTITDLYERYDSGCGQTTPAHDIDALRHLLTVSGVEWADGQAAWSAFWKLVFGGDTDTDRWADGSLDWPTEAQWDRFEAELARARAD